jgi:hypothetical protein
LILDDFAMSGDGLAEARDRLEAGGFAAASIRTAALVVSEIAIARNRAPDHYWRKVASIDFFFPWGRAR